MQTTITGTIAVNGLIEVTAKTVRQMVYVGTATEKTPMDTLTIEVKAATITGRYQFMTNVDSGFGPDTEVGKLSRELPLQENEYYPSKVQELMQACIKIFIGDVVQFAGVLPEQFKAGKLELNSFSIQAEH
jgi:hypothetical protein